MLSIDIDNLNKKDSRYAHALMLTLRHNKYMNSYLSLINDDNKYFVYGFGSFYDFNNIKEACLFIINVMCDDENELNKSINYFNNILKLDFSEKDAYDYLSFYNVDKTNKLVRK